MVPNCSSPLLLADPTSILHQPSLAGAVQQKKRKKEETDNVDALAKQYLQVRKGQ